MSVIFHNPMTFFYNPRKKSVRIYRVPKHLLTRSRFGKPFFANRSSCDRRARRENNKMNNTHAELNFYSSSNEKGLRQFQKLQMKNTNWSFNILMIFHEFSLLNFLWSCRHFILFSILKISQFLKLEKILKNWKFRDVGKNIQFFSNILFLTKISTFCRKYPLSVENDHCFGNIHFSSYIYTFWRKYHFFAENIQF